MENASYPCAAVERAMTGQDAILRAVDGRLVVPSGRDLGDLGPADATLEAAL